MHHILMIHKLAVNDLRRLQDLLMGAYLNIIVALLMCGGTHFLITVIPKLENVQDTHILAVNTKYQLRGCTSSLIISTCTVADPKGRIGKHIPP